jgi:hypothetical protein
MNTESPDPKPTIPSPRPDFPHFGSLLAFGARLAADRRLPREVVEERQGYYALCRLGGGGEIRRICPGMSIAFGRPENPIVSDWPMPGDSRVSKCHCRVFVDARGAATVEDLGSKNGTFVNDRRIAAPAALSRGDVLRLGGASFLFL